MGGEGGDGRAVGSCSGESTITTEANPGLELPEGLMGLGWAFGTSVSLTVCDDFPDTLRRLAVCCSVDVDAPDDDAAFFVSCVSKVDAHVPGLLVGWWPLLKPLVGLMPVGPHT